MKRSQINWEFGREILTKDDLIHAEAFWKHCLLSGYEEVYDQKLSELKNSINVYKSMNYGNN